MAFSSWRSRVRGLVCCVFAPALGLVAAVAGAQDGAAVDAQLPPVATPAWAAGFDALFAREMEARHIPGAVFAVVADGAIVYRKGYGAANLDTGEAVDPDLTLFRVASLSKLFTATAILQLAEAGKVDFDRDINTWLGDCAVPDAGFGPITLQDLLTHTPGFDDRYVGMSVLSPEDRLTLPEALRRVRPQRVLPPGKALMYSNYGYSLAGYIVERVSGMPFSAYVDANILVPLMMTQSGFRLQEAATPHLAQGYVYRGGQFEAMPYDYLNHYPAGSFMTTGDNMAHFMLAQLQDGRYREASMLRPASVALMQETHFRHAPGLNGWCYGFEEERERGVRVLTHGGSTSGFTSHVLLAPGQHAGYFFSCNHEATYGTAGGIVPVLTREFFDSVLAIPEPSKVAEAAPAAFKHSPGIEGIYRNMRYSRHSLAKTAALIDGPSAAFAADGSLRFGGGTYRAIGDDLFEQVDSGRRLAFLPAGDRTPAILAIHSMAFARVPAWDTPDVQQSLIGLCLLLLIVPQVVAAVRRWRRGAGSSLRLGWRMLALVGLLLPIFMGIVGYALLTMVRYTMFWGPSDVLMVALALPLVALALSVGALIVFVLQWRRGALRDRVEPALYLCAWAGAAGMLLLLFHWNLLGYILG